MLPTKRFTISGLFVSRNFNLTLFNNEPPNGLDEIRQIYEETFRRLDPDRKDIEIDVRFYPYVGINHTIRVRGGKVFVRIAEVCRGMPADEHRALASILVS